MNWLIVIFWILAYLIVYTYIGYAIVIWVLLRIRDMFNRKSTQPTQTHSFPKVAMIIPAFNEAPVIEEKIRNSLSLDYPENQLKIVFISDGSDDRTAEILENQPGIIHLHEPVRRGKAAAMNRAAEWCKNSEILVFSDANSMINPQALKLLVSHYSNPKVGGVSGEKKIIVPAGENLTEGESAYWKYESFLKKLDAEFYSIVGAAGELFSVRRSLYFPIKENTILDDFVLSLKVCEKGYVIKYEPNAVAAELPSSDFKEEEKRKIRIGAGAFQGMVEMRSLLNIFRFGKLSFQYISRRVFRWVFCPPALPILLFLNILIVARKPDPHWIYITILFTQIIFYFFAICGWAMNRMKTTKINFFYIPWYFLFMNFSVVMGLFRYLSGSQSALWEKSERVHRRITSIDRKNT